MSFTRTSMLLALLACALLHCSSAAFNPNPKGSGGIAFAFSGAGGRIAQHCALMESLVRGLNPSGKQVRPDVLSGASSGSISAVALNAIIYTEEHNLTNGFGWDDYKELMFTITSSDIYDNSWEGIAKIFAVNVFEGYFLDNSRLGPFLQPYLLKMGFNKLSDLPIPTAISIVNQTSGDSIRLWSNDPANADLDLLDIMIASASIPVAFPPKLIPSIDPVTLWIDGGTGIDTLPVYAPLHDAQVDELYVICYDGAFTSGGALDLPYYLQDLTLLKNSVAAIEDMRVDLFNGGIDIAQRSNVTSWLYMPSLNESFSALDFDHEKLQYMLTHQWTLSNDPAPLN
eukprot:TRINITY_DN2980_c0_g1_i1.p1 TRINITY_DN2980_c0_g1~~TRINITY_DN2980_c0_g1_i1.p1  ORF type:complete len:342 (+),score=61.73 TRINITY_DN2980_c0_g1_i1:104-1129(+)